METEAQTDLSLRSPSAFGLPTIFEPRRLNFDPTGRLRRWGALLGRFVAVQLVVQALGFLVGLWIIRALPAREYAYYTLANTVIGTLNLLSDSGISIGLSALAGQVWADASRFARLIETARWLRRRSAAGLAVVGLPCLVWLLRSQGAPWSAIVSLTILALLGTILHLDLDLLTVVPRFRGAVGQLQRIDLLGSGLRVVGLAVLLWTCGQLDAIQALLVATGAALAQVCLTRRYVAVALGPPATATPDPVFRAAILRAVRASAALALFNCFQGQITLWLIGVFGNTIAIAEVGALGRLAVLFSLAGTVQGNLLLPRFARGNDPATLRRRYVGIAGAAVALGIALLLAACAFPRTFLLLLGPKYLHLESVLPWMVGSAVLGFISATLWGLNASRAWIAGAWWNIPLTLAVQAGCLPLMDLGSVRDVLIFGLVSSVPALLVNVWLGWRGLNRSSGGGEVNRGDSEVETPGA